MADELELNLDDPKPEEKTPEMIAAEKATADAIARADKLQADLEAQIQRTDRVIAMMGEERPGDRPVAPVAPEEAPDPETDPQAYAAYIIDQRVEAKLKERLAPLEATYHTDRQVMLGTAEANAVGQVRGHYGESWEAHAAEVSELMKTMTPEMRANPAAWEQTFLAVKGKATVQAEREAAAREANPADGRGRPSSSAAGEPGLPTPSLSGPSARIAKHEGIDEASWQELKAPSYSIDEWQANKAKRDAAATKGRR